MKLKLKTYNNKQVIDITDIVNTYVVKNTNRGKVINIVVLHTTCGITTADLDPGTDQDYVNFIKELSPAISFNHPHDPEHFPDHMWSTLIGTSVTLPLSEKGLVLGKWQRLVLIEMAGPRERSLELTII
jgi:secondary thiamine-phosphate synthase enzyme